MPKLSEKMIDVCIATVCAVALVSVGIWYFDTPEHPSGYIDIVPIRGTATCHAAQSAFLAGPIERTASSRPISEQVRDICRDPSPVDCETNQSGPDVMYSKGDLDDSNWDSREFYEYCQRVRS